MLFDRGKVAAAAQEIVDHVKIIDHVKALQDAQKDIAQTCAKLGDRLTALEAELKTMRAEAALHAVKESQNIINSVQGNLNQRIESLAVKVGVLEAVQGSGRLTQVVREAHLIDHPEDPKLIR